MKLFDAARALFALQLRHVPNYAPKHNPPRERSKQEKRQLSEPLPPFQAGRGEPPAESPMMAAKKKPESKEPDGKIGALRRARKLARLVHKRRVSGEFAAGALWALACEWETEDPVAFAERLVDHYNGMLLELILGPYGL